MFQRELPKRNIWVMFVGLFHITHCYNDPDSDHVLWENFKDLESSKSFPKTTLEPNPSIRGSTIIVAYSNYYPHFTLHSNGSTSGFYADVLTAAQTYLGVNFEFIPSVDGHWGSLVCKTIRSKKQVMKARVFYLHHGLQQACFQLST